MESGILGLGIQLTRREIEARYRGSVLGVLWSFLSPLLMLVVFTFVFAIVIRARWGGAGETSLVQFGLIIFAGLTTFNLFGEVAGRAPLLIVGQPNLVKKVVFPLEILPVVAVWAALFQAGIAMVILIVFQITIGTGFHWTMLAVPVLIVPLAFFSLGIGWFLAAVGVYVRDVGQIVPPIITALLFLSPVFYPIAALPDWIRPAITFSPIAYSVETVREAVIFGRAPDVASFLFALAGGLAVAALGYAFFQKTRKGFADVL